MKMIIGGQKVDASDNRVIEVVNPANLQVIDTVPAATAEDIEKAMQCAQKGFEEWSEVPLYKRAAILEKCVVAMRENEEELAAMMVKENGKTYAEARGEMKASAGKCEVYINAAKYLEGNTYASDNCAYTEGSLILTTREPLGIVIGIIPFNSPVNVLINKVFPALIMGNSIIVKPASETPFTDIMLIDLFIKAGIPANACQIVTGSGSKIGGLLTGDPRIAAVAMTGSTKVGSDISQKAAKNFKRIMLELGGNDAFIIMKDADIDAAVKEALDNRSSLSGQVCCCPKRFIVHNSMKKEFMDKLAGKLEKIKVGNPEDPATEHGPLVSVSAAKQVEESVNLTVEQGGVILTGGKRFNESFFEMTLIDTPKTADSAGSLEIFGPVWTVIGFDTKEEALEIANNSQYGLDAGVMGNNLQDVMWLLKRLQAGTCVANGCGRFCPPYSPFGGYKNSGVGREGAFLSLEEMSQVKSVVFKRCF